ncbi:hypothetical protein DFJ43DRAFT_1066587 [Lentinula guzmanii]|uniref:Uncharacterized protein n=1 Tax=Lentinula guzmanii TaxID=2804957 RepID=A0AA38JBP9_9AGAR|nr:hypothetical protein DFJ43DRAFT_1066587 [Lentinula guzmanii]
MPRGKEKTVNFDLQEDVLPFMGSQDSNGSNGSEDNDAFQIAFAQQYRAALEKKKKEQQRKFFVSGKKSVSKEMENTAGIITDAARSAEELFQAFTINYAAEDDRIRSLWSAILEEERKLQKLSKQFQSAIVKMGQECETEQIQGMAKAKEAVLETQKVIEYVYPKKELP